MTKEPDNLEKSIRFGCGSLFGSFLGILFVIRFLGAQNPGFVSAVILVAVICGYLALKLGDKFWNFFIK